MSPLSCFLALLLLLLLELSYISFYSTFCISFWYIFQEFPRENSCLIDVDWTGSGERVIQSTASMSPSSSHSWHTSATRGRGPHVTQVKLHQHVVTRTVWGSHRGSSGYNVTETSGWESCRLLLSSLHLSRYLLHILDTVLGDFHNLSNFCGLQMPPQCTHGMDLYPRTRRRWNLSVAATWTSISLQGMSC